MTMDVATVLPWHRFWRRAVYVTSVGSNLALLIGVFVWGWSVGKAVQYFVLQVAFVALLEVAVRRRKKRYRIPLPLWAELVIVIPMVFVVLVACAVAVFLYSVPIALLFFPDGKGGTDWNDFGHTSIANLPLAAAAAIFEVAGRWRLLRDPNWKEFPSSGWRRFGRFGQLLGPLAIATAAGIYGKQFNAPILTVSILLVAKTALDVRRIWLAHKSQGNPSGPDSGPVSTRGLGGP